VGHVELEVQVGSSEMAQDLGPHPFAQRPGRRRAGRRLVRADHVHETKLLAVLQVGNLGNVLQEARVRLG
jgi:hypothetical protein